MIDHNNMKANRRSFFVCLWNTILAMKDISNTDKIFLADVLTFEDGGYYKNRKAIASILNISPDSVTSMISKLCKKGYITRDVIRDEKNQVVRAYTRPTQKLYDVLNGLKESAEEMIAKSCESTPIDEAQYPTPTLSEGDPSPKIFGDPSPKIFGDPSPKIFGDPSPKIFGVKNTYKENTELRTQEEDKSASSKPVSTQKKKKVFSPPTRQEAEAYHAEKGYGFDLDEFFDYYEPRDWRDKSGRKISSWKSCMATFERNRKRWAAERLEEQKEKEEAAQKAEGERKSRDADDWALWDRNLQYAREREEEEKKLKEKKGLMEGGTLYAT